MFFLQSNFKRRFFDQCLLAFRLIQHRRIVRVLGAVHCKNVYPVRVSAAAYFSHKPVRSVGDMALVSPNGMLHLFHERFKLVLAEVCAPLDRLRLCFIFVSDNIIPHRSAFVNTDFFRGFCIIVDAAIDIASAFAQPFCPQTRTIPGCFGISALNRTEKTIRASDAELTLSDCSFLRTLFFHCEPKISLRRTAKGDNSYSFIYRLFSTSWVTLPLPETGIASPRYVGSTPKRQPKKSLTIARLSRT